MKAFRVTVDGNALGDLGLENTNNSSVIVGIGPTWGPDDIEYRLHVGGITNDDENGGYRHFRWACPKIGEGSRIEIEIVDSGTCVPPTKIFRSDAEVQESSFTDEEMREMRYESYLELKKEFEG